MSAGDKEKNVVSSEVLGRAGMVTELVEYADGAIVSKTLVDKHIGTITLFAFDRGQRLSTHQAPFDAVVEVVEGSALITIGQESISVCAGQMIVMPANIPHSVNSQERFKMLLTMIRA